jgi:hypothetical protein
MGALGVSALDGVSSAAAMSCHRVSRSQECPRRTRRTKLRESSPPRLILLPCFAGIKVPRPAKWFRPRPGVAPARLGKPSTASLETDCLFAIFVRVLVVKVKGHILILFLLGLFVKLSPLNETLGPSRPYLLKKTET